MSLSTSDLGRRIRDLRLRRRLSQRQLAEPRYDGSFVSQIEAGRRAPSPGALAYFATRLGVSVEELAAPVPPSLRVELELALADAKEAFDAGDPARTKASFERLLALASAGGSREFEAEALLGLSELEERGGRIAEAIAGYQRAEALAESEHLLIRLKLAQGRAYRSGGDLAYSIDVLQQTVPRALQQGWLVDAVRGAVLLATTFSERGDHQRAREVLDGVAEQARTLDDPRALAAWHWVRGRNVASLGHPEDALEHLAIARGIYEQQSAKVEMSRLDGARAQSLMELDRHAEAVALYEGAVERLSAAGVVHDAARMRSELARAHLAIGHRREAIRLAEENIGILRQMDDPLEAANSMLVLGLAIGTEPRAEQLLRDAVDAFDAHGAAEQRARALHALGEYYVMTGRQDEALDVFRRALAGVVR
jgi:tetratricopeptide (TPR) repeat protein